MVWEKTWPSPPEASTTARQCTAPTPSRWPSPITCRVTPAMPDGGVADRAVEQQVDGQRVLDDLDLGGPLDGGDQGPLDLGSGRVPAGVRDPVAVVAALTGQAQLAVRLLVEDGAQRDQLVDGGRSLGHQGAYGGGVTGTGARDEGVPLVVGRGVLGAQRRGDPALRPLGGAGVEDVLGDHQQLEPRSAAWMRSAAVSPAMPDPMTTTSDRVVHPGSGAVRRCGTRRLGEVAMRAG